MATCYTPADREYSDAVMASGEYRTHFNACQKCAVLIVNDDNSADAFDPDPEWRRDALESALTERFARFPVHACETDDEGECDDSQRDGSCDVCGDEIPDSLHVMEADYCGRTYPGPDPVCRAVLAGGRMSDCSGCAGCA